MPKKTKEFFVVIEQDDNGYYIGSVSDLPGCYADGKTIAQVEKNLAKAIPLYLEACKSVDCRQNRGQCLMVKKLSLAV